MPATTQPLQGEGEQTCLKKKEKRRDACLAPKCVSMHPPRPSFFFGMRA